LEGLRNPNEKGKSVQFYFFLELDGVNAPGLPDTKEYMTLLAPGYTGNEKLGGKTRYGALVSVATTEWVKLKPNRDNFRYKYHRPPQVCIPMDGEVHRVRIHAYIKNSDAFEIYSPYEVEQKYMGYTDFVLSCKPCSYKIKITSNHTRCSSQSGPAFGDPRICCKTCIHLENSGGNNDVGCVGGWKLQKAGLSGGELMMEQEDDPPYERILNPSLPSSVLHCFTCFSGGNDYEDILELYDRCARVLEEIPIKIQCICNPPTKEQTNDFQ